MSFIERLRRLNWRPIDRRPIYESLADDLVLPPGTPYPGPFNVHNSPWIKPILDAIAEDGCKRVLVSGAAQLGKTLLGIIFLIWCVLRRPGLTTWTGQTDPAIRKFAEDKAWPILRVCRSLMALLPSDRNKIRTRSVVFPHMSMRFQGASENNAHGDTVLNQINDERHLWAPGLIYKFDSRVGSLPHAKQLDLSTGSCKYGVEEMPDGTSREFGDDFFNQCRDATQEVWSVCCPKCGRLQPLAWRHRASDGSDLRDSDGNPVFGFGWDDNEETRPGGRWNFGKVKKTARWQCQADALGIRTYTYERRGGATVRQDITEPCRFILRDTPENIRALNALDAGACYQVTNPLADPSVRSFTFPAMVSELVGWGTLTVEWLKAIAAASAGNFGPLQTFVQNRLAQAWDSSITIQPESKPTGDYMLGDAWLDPDGNPVDARRCMAIDRQRGKQGEGLHFWAGVRDISSEHGSRLVWFGRLESYEACREKQRELGIQDNRVIIDAGDQAREVYSVCCKYGWTAFAGRDVEFFSWSQSRTAPVRKLWSRKINGDPIGVRKKTKGTKAGRKLARIPLGSTRFARLFLWARTPVQDILAGLIAGTSSYWGRPKNEPKEYSEQLNSEIKKQVRDKRGRLRFMWVQIRVGIDNHARDIEAMLTVAALMSGLLKPDIADTPDPVRERPATEDDTEHMKEVRPNVRKYVLKAPKANHKRGI